MILDLPSIGLRDPSVLPKYARSTGSGGIMIPPDPDDLFEDAVSFALQSSGLRVKQLGHLRRGKAEPDGLARMPAGTETAFAIIYDAKSTPNPYTLPRSDTRALGEYAIRYCHTWAARRRFEHAFLLIVSPKFSKRAAGNGDTIRRRYSTEIPIEVVLMEAEALQFVAALAIEDCDVDGQFYESLFVNARNPIKTRDVEEVHQEFTESRANF
jgi:hypothetical protein